MTSHSRGARNGINAHGHTENVNLFTFLDRWKTGLFSSTHSERERQALVWNSFNFAREVQTTHSTRGICSNIYQLLIGKCLGYTSDGSPETIQPTCSLLIG
jgi:hypothetical protein